MSNKVAILTINYTSKVETINLIKNLEILEGDFELFLIENGSPINRIKPDDLPKTKYKKHFFISKKNLGYAGGNNFLLKKAKKYNYDFYWFLNNDTEVKKDSLKKLLQVFDEDKKAGIAGSLVVQNGNKVWWAGSVVDLQKGKIFKKYYGEDVTKIPKGVYETDEINGAVMLVRKEVIQKIGYLDTVFFHTAEDTDYSLRAKKEGYALYVNTNSIVFHSVGKSSGGSYSPLHMYYVERGRIMLMRKWRVLKISSLFFLIPLWLKRIAAPTIKNGDFKSSIYTIKGIIEGFILPV